VRQPAGQLADRFHLLALPQLVLGPLPLHRLVQQATVGIAQLPLRGDNRCHLPPLPVGNQDGESEGNAGTDQQRRPQGVADPVEGALTSLQEPRLRLVHGGDLGAQHIHDGLARSAQNDLAGRLGVAAAVEGNGAVELGELLAGQRLHLGQPLQLRRAVGNQAIQMLQLGVDL
jgi:hypothetical protein